MAFQFNAASGKKLSEQLSSDNYRSSALDDGHDSYGSYRQHTYTQFEAIIGKRANVQTGRKVVVTTRGDSDAVLQKLKDGQSEGDVTIPSWAIKG